jgi:hypothetical protein
MEETHRPDRWCLSVWRPDGKTHRPNEWNSGQMNVRTGWLDRPDGKTHRPEWWNSRQMGVRTGWHIVRTADRELEILLTSLWTMESLLAASLHISDFVQTQNEAKILTLIFVDTLRTNLSFYLEVNFNFHFIFLKFCHSEVLPYWIFLKLYLPRSLPSGSFVILKLYLTESSWSFIFLDLYILEALSYWIFTFLMFCHLEALPYWIFLKLYLPRSLPSKSFIFLDLYLPEVLSSWSFIFLDLYLPETVSF